MWGAVLVLAVQADSSPTNAVERRLSLSECVRMAIDGNRDLQIERVNPRIARLTLDASAGYYDPTLALAGQHTHQVETGGFDPVDLSRYNVHQSDSELANAALTGFLPSGMTYTFWGDYSHTVGLRQDIGIEEFRAKVGVSVRQPLLRDFWTDEPRTTIKINRKSLRVSELNVRFVLMEVIHRVELAYYELAFAREDLEVQRKLVEVRQAFQDQAHQQVITGAIPAIEEKLAEAEVARARSALLAARIAVTLAENELKTAVGDDFRSSEGVDWVPSDSLLVLPDDLSLQESWQRGITHRPDVAQMRIEVEKQELNLRFRRNQLYPWLDVVAGYGQRGSSAFENRQPPLPPASRSEAFDQVLDGVAPNDLIGLMFTMPLSRAVERANYRAGKELKEQATLFLKQREELVLREVSDALLTARAERERVEVARRAATLAREALVAEEQKLAAGQSMFYVVLQLQGDLATARSEEARAKGNYNMALSRLHRAEGSLLDRYNTDVEFK